MLLAQTSTFDPQQYVPVVVSAVVTFLIFVVAFLVIYLVGRSLVARTVRESLERRGFEASLVGLAVSTAVVITAVVALALAATIAGFGVVLSAFAILASALALALGFAVQDVIENFVAGVFIIQEEPFTIGDWIEWGGNEGVVREIELRVTTLDTFDNERVTVPNGDLANATVINKVANDERRISVGFGIGYGDDIEGAREAIVEEGGGLEGVLEAPAPSAPVVELGDSAVVLSGRVWIDPVESSYGAVRAAFVEAVKGRFDAEGIDMPYPNTELSGGVEVTSVEADSTGVAD